ncbi:hypothetical protein [Aquitalea aquatica]|uniref:Uncharacterized protein n=1 Tax=Aquitalea aquatica TaxID=3044273 RepID=A0A838Y0V7_9NEIS|nr:hypothetical protein [Aquitalea magnusonii]MBA4707538.1 hypothetical protein [Aquitalea magnusonii]
MNEQEKEQLNKIGRSLLDAAKGTRPDLEEFVKSLDGPEIRAINQKDVESILQITLTLLQAIVGSVEDIDTLLTGKDNGAE